MLGYHSPGTTYPPRLCTPLTTYPPRTTYPPDYIPPAPWTTYPPGLCNPREQTPPGSRLQHTVYERPVRILLECILVYSKYTVVPKYCACRQCRTGSLRRRLQDRKWNLRVDRKHKLSAGFRTTCHCSVFVESKRLYLVLVKS